LKKTAQQHYSRTTANSAQTTTSGGGSLLGNSNQNMPDETVFVPPISMFLLGGIGIIVSVVATLWQMFTSFSAFQSMFITGTIYRHMVAADQAKALPIVNVICAIIAISFQLSILFLVFRIERVWKEKKAQGQGNKIEQARHTAVEVIQHIPLVLIWGVLGFIADTLGDYNFISLYSDNVFILFMYGASLYASSTIMLVRSIEYLWAGFVAWEKWKAFRWHLFSKQSNKGEN